MTSNTAEEAPVAALGEMLAALGDPVRLEMVRRLWDAGAPVACARLYDEVSKSTASHHFKVLREAGVTRRVVLGGQVHQELRKDELATAYGPLVESVVNAANR